MADLEAAPRETMRALVAREYGRPELVEVPAPAPGAGEVRVRVRACSVNPVDAFVMTGTPYFGRLFAGLRRPREPRVGADFAGTIDAVGSGVTSARVGDEVFGAARGAMAQWVCVSEARMAPKPARLSFEEAAALPVAGLTALQGLRDHGRLRAGHAVIVNGASGGVGTFAVQIAKALGARVTAVCSTQHLDTVRAIGADRVIDYTREDFTTDGARYDLMFDVAGSRSWSEATRVLQPEAPYVAVGGPRAHSWLGPLGHLIRLRIASLGARRRLVFFMARVDRADLTTLADLAAAGTIRAVVERRHPFEHVVDAYRHLAEGHADGKIVVSL